MKLTNILITEDDEWYSEFLSYHLNLHDDINVDIAKDGKTLLEKINKDTDIITLDYSLPDTNGEQLLQKIKYEYPDKEVIIISGQEDIEVAIGLMNMGAYTYIVKNEQIKEILWNTIIRIKEKLNLQNEVSQLRKEVSIKYDFSSQIKGSSQQIKALFELLTKATKSNINISITGETGTGKEITAKAIHFNSDRKKEPFIAVNVSAIPSELIESELFGHEKGAFTGAVQQRIGKFEEAGKGTLFLDEIGEMDLSMQSKLLRVLQEREITRVGGNGIKKINCRIISATHNDLADNVNQGTFREDLYYRLIGLPIKLPSLRERKEDIIILAKHFIDLFVEENGYQPKKLSEDASKKLLSYRFPGNIRELKSIIDLAIVLSDNESIEAENIQYNTRNPMNLLEGSDFTMREYEHKILSYYMEKYSNNVLLVAEKLNIGKSTIYRMLKEEI
ncbi:MAG: sigma-54 dependent transcriptional regulator [Crocinitomicaceae bacterium]|nr:sigma-54 dependent transcriptional regulator [Crocinitomicaceae bacterium]